MAYPLRARLIGVGLLLGILSGAPGVGSDARGGAPPFTVGYQGVEELLRVVRDRNSSMATRLTAISRLGRNGAQAASAVPDIHQFLLDHEGGKISANYRIEQVVFDALAHIGKPSVPLLVKMLREKQEYDDNHARGHAYQALKTLREIGPPARESAPEILRLMSQVILPQPRPPRGTTGKPIVHGNPGGSYWLLAGARAIENIQPDPDLAVPVLLEILRKMDFGDQGISKGSRSRFGPIEACDIVSALGALGPGARTAVDDLVSILNSPAAKTQSGLILVSKTISALGKIGPDAKGAIPAMRPFLNHSNPGLADSTEKAIAKILHKE
jgi:hypothetical protein